MKLWRRRVSPHDPLSHSPRAEMTTLLIVLACLAAAALEMCDEVHQHSQRGDSPRTNHVSSR